MEIGRSALSRDEVAEQEAGGDRAHRAGGWSSRFAGGAGLIFLALCWLLHRRERVLATNRSAVPATT